MWNHSLIAGRSFFLVTYKCPLMFSLAPMEAIEIQLRQYGGDIIDIPCAMVCSHYQGVGGLQFIYSYSYS